MKTQKTILASIIALMFTSAHGAEETKNVEEEIEVIQVTGILGSMEASVRMKRFADTVVDVITAEDIGQFSDDSIAGAIMRIPGVQIETDDAGTDGDRVSIRGLGPEFVNATINGRTLLSSGNEGKSLRKMNFNAFPPGVLAGVTVAKGQTASRPESGLAGQIDLQTLKPLEISKLENKNSFTQLSVRGSQNDLDDETGFRASVLTAWRNDDSDLGGYISLVIGEDKNARDQLRINYRTRDLKIDEGNVDPETGDPIIKTISDASIPFQVTMNPIRETVERTAIATGIQYQPNDDVDINWDLMYTNYNNESMRDQYLFQLHHVNVWGRATFDNSDAANPGVVVDENNVVRYANFGLSSGTRPIQAKSTTMLFNNETENLITGLNVDWAINDSLTSNFDIYLSTVDYNQDLRFPRFQKNLDNSQFIYDATGNIATVMAPDANDIAGYAYDRVRVREISTEADNFGLTAAFSYDIDENDLFSSVDFGIHYDETDIEYKRSKIGASALDAAGKAEVKAAAFTGDMLGQDFLGGDVFSPERWFIGDYDAAVAADPINASKGWDELGVDPLQAYDMTESILALYGQVNLDTELFDLPLTGNIGVRAVLTDNESTAEQSVDGVVAPVTVSNDYWEYLPSVNLNLALNDDMALRFGLSKTLSRPDYQQLAPINKVNIGNEDGDIGSATVGNPYLDPMTSVNFDITYEWYTQYDGAFVLSGFYKDVSDFIVKETSGEAIPLPGFEGLYNVTTFINLSDGNAKGYEIGLFQPLDKIFPALAGFGFSANYTFVDSEFDKDVGDGGFGFPGSSEDNVNFIGFYEADSYAIRVAYTYRSEFFRSLEGTGSQGSSARFTGAQENLNVSVNVKPMKGLSVRFAANNITNEKRRDFIGVESNFMDYFDRGRTYSITANYSF